MNELDLRIAELKGWREPTRADLEEISEIEARQRRMIHHFNLVRKRPDGFDTTTMRPGLWSTSDAKAFELVDELIAKGMQFALHSSKGYHEAVIRMDPRQFTIDPRHPWQADGKSRPEAICRAYLAAMEWLNSRKKEA